MKTQEMRQVEIAKTPQGFRELAEYMESLGPEWEMFVYGTGWAGTTLKVEFRKKLEVPVCSTN